LVGYLGKDEEGTGEEEVGYYTWSILLLILLVRRGEGEGETYNQKLPARRICSPPAVIPPMAKPIFVGMRIEPAEAGDHPRTAIA
jgi:hypothetical protein